MADLGAIEEDVRFDYGAADRLASLCDSAAGVIDGQAGSRASWKNTALTEFRGHFSQLFRSNASVAAADAAELADRLREVAGFTRRLKEEAEKEQERRETARQWKQEQDDRNLWDKGVDAVFGGDDPPVGPPAAEPTFPVSASRNGTRETPAPGSGGGGGGGTSSAKPEDLRSFATGSRGANNTLRPKVATCRSAYSTFVAGCGWGRLEASGVFAGFDTYVDANEEDVRWATVVADAFAAAGGEGAVSTLSDSALMATLQAAGLSATRQDLVIDPPTAYGSPPTTGYANDPVNTATGNFLENEVDLSFPGGAGTLALARTYNSFDTGTAAFGPGWSSWTEAGLALDDEAARLRLPDGRVIVFPRLGDGWDRATGESMWLDAVDGGFRARDNDGRTWDFTAAGELHAVARGHGTRVTLTHDGGRLVRLDHERGRSIELAWRDEVVVAATSSDGRRVDFGYDEHGRLTTVTTPSGTRTYRWNDAGLIEAVTDADGVLEAENAYDAQGRVTTQRSQHGRLTRFAYLPGNVTVVSDPDGSRSNTWIHDHRGRLIGVVDSHEQRQSTSYDPHGNAVLVTERDGAVTVHEYDDRGRRTRTVTPTGDDLTYGYDDSDRVTAVVTESGATTGYTYDESDPASRNPSTMVDAEGGETRFTWKSGLLVEVVDPVGVTVRFDYDDHGDLVATTDALGNTARLERDTTGRVMAAVTPSGARTSYSYSPSGHLASRRDPDGAVWRYEHTTAGRLSAVVDPTGARTEIEHGTHGDEARTIDPLGRAVTRHLDDLGNLASVELPDGSRWEFTHDSLSRLVATTDPTGATWERAYDPAGELVAAVDPTGVRQSVTSDRASGNVTVNGAGASVSARFDPLGRPLSSENPDGSAALTTYDRCGRPVELLDAEGSLTRIRRDAAGRVVEVVGPTGGSTRHEYDPCGRLSATVDAMGARTTFHYDADGRLVRRGLPTGEEAWTEYDVCSRVVARFEPGRGVARYRYDAAGRVVESSDTWFGRRKYRYDAAGQLVEVVNGNGGITRYDYDANGRAVAITDPLGHTTRREFDAMNRCVAETDPLGRTTRAGYDAAGRPLWQEDPAGTRISWTYDAAGVVSSTEVDGRTVSAIERDVRNRRVTLRDHTRADGREVVHELGWNARNQLVSRGRDGRTLSWAYDAAGRRSSMTTPDGHRTDYTWDEAGRLTAVDHPLLGRAVLERDAAGRLVQATADGIIQSWEHRDGFVVAHTVTDAQGATRTLVSRDDAGRITGLDRDGVTATFVHDEALQLVEARGATVTRWRFDAAGRLVAQSRDGEQVEHSYDAAGQLLESRAGDGSSARHSYDAAGRRTRTERSDGSVRQFGWSATSRLTHVVDDTDDGAGERRTHVHVDATGELADVDGTEVFFDAAQAYAPSLVQVGDTPVVSAGPVTGIGDTWTTPGWRSSRGTGNDPWPSIVAAQLPSGLAIGAAGELEVAGLEWLGARVYDPASRGFLTVDPLDPVTGSGWSGNPYSYAGNDPLHLLDPTGLRPVTDAELAAYAAANNGALAAAGDWVKDNWEYLAGGAMVIAGGVLVATGVGGPAGMMLISAGADTIIQKATTGSVNWGQVAISGAFGAFGGTGVARSLGANTLLKQRIVGGMISGTASGATGGAYSYATGPGPHTPGGFVRATAFGGGTGLLTGGAAGGFGHAVDAGAMRYLPRTQVIPEPDLATQGRELLGDPGSTVVLGRQPDTAVAQGWDGHTVLDTPNWSPELNDEFVRGAVDYQRPIYLASPVEGNMVTQGGPRDGLPTVYATELNILDDAGYTRSGDYMVGP
ncbi:DUF6531 domain-containing protein [Nocardioides sp. GXQ0305]|uniref:DUF6531 domain-containing protein n=1 Tax=Nocardioides sp. GXQ0305 TaxID=3423912 RepID=UPI003D7C5C05